MTEPDERVRGMQIEAAELALAQAEKKHGAKSAEICQVLETLGELYVYDGLYGKAELVYRRLVDALQEQGQQSAAIDALCKLGATCRGEHKWDDAEAGYLKALAIPTEGAESKRRTAEQLGYLAGIYCQKRAWGEAEAALTKASDLFAQEFAGHNNFTRLCQLGLATICTRDGRMGEAEDWLNRSMKEPEGVDELSSNQRALIRLAQEYFRQGRITEVELLLEQTIYRNEHKFWPLHHCVGEDFHNRGELFLAQALYNDAEIAFKRALEIRLQALGQAHSDVAQTAMSLACMYISQGRFVDAEPVLRQAMKTRVLVFGVEHPGVAAAIETYVSVLKNTKRQSIALKLEARARDIRSRLVWESERATAAGRPATS